MMKSRRFLRARTLVLVLLMVFTGVSTASAASTVHVYLEARTVEDLSGEFEDLGAFYGGFIGDVYGDYITSQPWFDDDIGMPYFADPGDPLEYGHIEKGSSYRYKHRFDQDEFGVEEVLDAFLVVGFTQASDEDSLVRIRVAGDIWKNKESVWDAEGFFTGEVSLDALDQTKINVKVKAFKADVDLFGSVLAVAYRGTGPSAAVPEPGAALLFSAGAGIVAFSMRRRK